MAYTVLIVDDSNFFQTRLKEVVDEHPMLKVIGVATNGQEAIDMALKLKPDVITMDYEMPMLDGLSAVKVIMQECPTAIVMFSSMTYEGAKITLDALEAGAVDFMNKNFAEVSNNSKLFKQKLHEKLIMFAKSHKESGSKPGPAVEEPAAPAPPPAPTAGSVRRSAPRRPVQSSAQPEPLNNSQTQPPARTQPSGASSYKSGQLKGKVKLLALGASTGGPIALAEIVNALPANFPVPVVVIQHMPENFTRAFAERMNRQSQLNVKEAEEGDQVARGTVLVAPGGMQMIFDRSGSVVKLIPGDDRVNYKPCLDITYASAANAFGGGVLAVILTGMGSDGCEGARILKQQGSSIWSQDKETCVVYGMPAAVAKQNLTDRVLPIKEMAAQIVNEL